MNMKNNSLDRFTVCLEKGLLSRLDGISSERGYPSRSQAIADFIRRAIVKKEWRAGNVLSSQSHGLRGGKTLCTVTVTGRPAQLQRLADSLRALKGVTHGAFSIIAPL